MTNIPSVPVVRLKKMALILVILGMLFIALMIVYNLSVSTQAPKPDAAQAEKGITVSNGADRDWYQAEGQASSKTPAEQTQPVLSNNQKQASLKHAVNASSESHLESVSAMRAPLNSNQLVADIATPHREDEMTNATSNAPNTATGKTLSTPYIIQPGTFIPAVLITGINSDLPGQIIAQVRETVYDSVTGRYPLIPQGSKLIGVYDAKIVYGQERVLVAWQQLYFPNGQSLSLSDMAGVDNSGYAGFHDEVNAHYQKLLGSAVLMSVLGASAQLSQPQHTTTSENRINPMTLLVENAASSVMHTAAEMTSKNLNIQPTLEIRPGYTFNVSVSKALVFPNAYEGESS